MLVRQTMIGLHHLRPGGNRYLFTLLALFTILQAQAMEGDHDGHHQGGSLSLQGVDHRQQGLHPNKIINLEQHHRLMSV